MMGTQKLGIFVGKMNFLGNPQFAAIPVMYIKEEIPGIAKRPFAA